MKNQKKTLNKDFGCYKLKIYSKQMVFTPLKELTKKFNIQRLEEEKRNKELAVQFDVSAHQIKAGYHQIVEMDEESPMIETSSFTGEEEGWQNEVFNISEEGSSQALSYVCEDVVNRKSIPKTKKTIRNKRRQPAKRYIPRTQDEDQLI